MAQIEQTVTVRVTVRLHALARPKEGEQHVLRILQRDPKVVEAKIVDEGRRR